MRNMDLPKTPDSGFKLSKLYAIQLAYEVVNPDNQEVAPGGRPLMFAWDWRLLGAGVIEVQFGIEVQPTRAFPERIEATLVGRFESLGSAGALPVESFAKINAPAILMPYIREAISSLSSRGAFGPYLLPPLNVVELMGDLSQVETTAQKQLREDPSLADAYGISPTIADT